MGQYLTPIIILVAVFLALLLISGIRFIPNNRIGIVEKRFGTRSLKSGFIALHKEAGYQPNVLRSRISLAFTRLAS